LLPSIGRYHNEPSHRVLIADDHAIFRQGLATIINRDPDMQVIAQAENGEQAITLFENIGCHADGSANEWKGGLPAIGAICATAKSELLY